MAYHIELHKDFVEPYLADVERISLGVREVLARGFDELAEHADFFMGDPHYRLSGTPYFQFDRILRDPDTGKLHAFYFVVSDEAAQFGVLRIVFVEEKT